MTRKTELSRRVAAAWCIALALGGLAATSRAAGKSVTPTPVDAPRVAAHSGARSGAAVKPVTLTSKMLKDWSWRSVGPANCGGRISDFAVVESKPSTFFVGTATGGLFKTVNNGTTWSAVFDKQTSASIGAVAVWQKNPDVVYAGTGEANNRNSSAWGDGVYRSLDGGATWENVGLRATRHIARVVIDPTDSATVYVAAMGKLWGANAERGVYKTTDAGKSWSQVMKVDDRTGCTDLVMDPSDPKTLYAAFYTRERRAFSYTAGSTVGGIFVTHDGGTSWTKCTAGLPVQTGRIGLDIYRKNPRVVFAVVQSDSGGTIDPFVNYSKAGGIFRSDDRGAHWTRLAPYTPRAFYFSQIRVAPDDSSRVYIAGFDALTSDDGGSTLKGGLTRNIHGDCHAMWIDPANSSHVLLGTDGGVYVSYDKTATWDFVNNLAIGEFYNIAVDMRDPYYIYGGLQDNQSWGGPSKTLTEVEQFFGDGGHRGITNGDWFCLGGGDGFHVAVDPTDPMIVYNESQGGELIRQDLRSGKVRALKPGAPEGTEAYRFNWNTPVVMSPHDPTVLWMGGNRLFKLTRRGDTWQYASPDLTTRDPNKMLATGSGAETHCTIVSISESAAKAGVLWCGTDDGKVWTSPDGGMHWTDCTANFPRGKGAMPAGLYVSSIDAGHQDSLTAYITFDGHRSDVVAPFVFATHDGGKSWRSLSAGLPESTVCQRVREGLTNRDLLYVGAEHGIFVSLDGGAHWLSLKGESLPTVAVDDIVTHPRDHDLVIGTHGRSVYVMDDVTPFEQWTPRVLTDSLTFFAPRPATEYYVRGLGGIWGSRIWTGKNPAFGASFSYFVTDEIEGGVSIAIADTTGRALKTLTGDGKPGLHRVQWDFSVGESWARMDRPQWGGQPAYPKPGPYIATLTFGDKRQPLTQTLWLKEVPGTADPE